MNFRPTSCEDVLFFHLDDASLWVDILIPPPVLSVSIRLKQASKRLLSLARCSCSQGTLIVKTNS